MPRLAKAHELRSAKARAELRLCAVLVGVGKEMGERDVAAAADVVVVARGHHWFADAVAITVSVNAADDAAAASFQ